MGTGADGGSAARGCAHHPAVTVPHGLPTLENDKDPHSAQEGVETQWRLRDGPEVPEQAHESRSKPQHTQTPAPAFGPPHQAPLSRLKASGQCRPRWHTQALRQRTNSERKIKAPENKHQKGITSSWQLS